MPLQRAMGGTSLVGLQLMGKKTTCDCLPACQLALGQLSHACLLSLIVVESEDRSNALAFFSFPLFRLSVAAAQDARSYH